MAIKFNRSQTFATNGTVTAAGLHNLIDGTDIYQALITDQPSLTAVATDDSILIADASLTAGDAPRQTTVSNLFEDALTISTYTNANINNISYGTSTGTRLISTNATITTGTIPNLTSSTASITIGTIPTLTAGTTTSTAANITNGTIQNLTSNIVKISSGSAILSQGTITNLNSTTGTISNLSTTIVGDFTISQGTGTLGTTGVSAGTYGTLGIIPTISVDSKGRITTVSTSVSVADASITPSKLSQPLTIGTAQNTTSGTAIDFTGIPSWVKKITIMLNGISTNGTSNWIIQIGSTTFKTSGYLSYFGYVVNDTNALCSSSTSGFGIYNGNSANLDYGQLFMSNITGNTWVYNYSGGNIAGASPAIKTGGGSASLTDALDRVRLTTANGTDTFDAGSVNIMYEG